MIYYNYFGDYLKKRRKESKLTLKELAEKLSLTHGYISNVENSKMKANMDLIEGIYAVLGVPVEESLFRLRMDNGDYNEFLNDIRNNSIRVSYNNILTSIFYSSPGKFYMLSLRIESKKTLTEIAHETQLTTNEIIDLENHGPSNLPILDKFGTCYGKKDLLKYLNHEVDLPPISIRRTQTLMSAKNTSELSELKFTLWGNVEGLDLPSLISDHYPRLTYPKNNDLLNLLSDYNDLYFDSKLLSDKDRKRVIQLIDLLLDKS
ncbi:helix-turn-helix domain-containing protein [Paucisalibacillus globulus]|uniref:helix-turn-helix domain-containing protein n=1 Tax=Paucisalibacillus globulus TaxID=351095 RepID=UPI000BB77495|nr:helix-turn-helix transcriptional regulator [Paucisalibacillus globulus]